MDGDDVRKIGISPLAMIVLSLGGLLFGWAGITVIRTNVSMGIFGVAVSAGVTWVVVFYTPIAFEISSECVVIRTLGRSKVLRISSFVNAAITSKRDRYPSIVVSLENGRLLRWPQIWFREPIEVVVELIKLRMSALSQGKIEET